MLCEGRAETVALHVIVSVVLVVGHPHVAAENVASVEPVARTVGGRQSPRR